MSESVSGNREFWHYRNFAESKQSWKGQAETYSKASATTRKESELRVMAGVFQSGTPCIFFPAIVRCAKLENF